MTKQEDIREVIDAHTDDRCLYPDKGCVWCSKEGYCASGNDAYTCLMKRLDELGVVIKVDRELPEMPSNYDSEDNNYLYSQAQEDMLKAGYVAVEPLIKKEVNQDDYGTKVER